jgi:hypothetical protein
MPAEYTSRHNITGEAIADLWTKHSERYKGSLGRIVDAREYLLGKKQAPLPEQIASRPDGEAFRVDTATKYVSAMQLVNKLSKPVPQMSRPKTATSDLGERTASRIEKFINPAVRDNLSHRDLIELLLIEAEACALIVPEVARFGKVEGSYYEDDGETIKKAYQRDEKGRTYDDALEDDYEGDEERAKAEFKVDDKRSDAAYERHIRHLRARHYPFDIQLLSRQQMIPINPQIKGATVTVDGIISRTRMAPSEAMRRHYKIDGLKEHLEPTGELEGDQDTGDLWLYQAVMTDQDADGKLYPYFAYSLAGKATNVDRVGFEKDAVIDLRKHCGLTTLPVVYGYGWRWFNVNPDDRSMQYTFPFMRSELAKDAFLTGKAYAGWAAGMPAWFMQMPDSVKDVAMQQAWMEFINTRKMVIKPFEILPVWGNMVVASNADTGRDVNEMVAALGGSNDRELVNPLARGGGDATSAIERSVVSADTVAGIIDVQDSALSMTARIGEIVLEICAGVERETGQQVLIYGNTDTPSDRGDDSSATKAIIELKRYWLGPDGEESYDLEAYLPESLGDKLAEKAQLFGFYKENAISFEQWCTAIGVSDPERFRAQLLFDRWIMSDQGMQVAMGDAADFLGDQDLIRRFNAQKSGAMGPGGEQAGMLAGVNPPMGAVGPAGDPGAQAMTQMQDPAASQYAAIVGAERNASAAAVGPAPSTVNGMGGV